MVRSETGSPRPDVTPETPHPRLAAARRWISDARGATAVEFALVPPVVLALRVGAAGTSHATIDGRRVTLLARTLADLTSKGDTSDPVASAAMSDILAASTAVLRPFTGSDARIVVSALGVEHNTPQTSPSVCSGTATSNTAARSVGMGRTPTRLEPMPPA